LGLTHSRPKKPGFSPGQKAATQYFGKKNPVMNPGLLFTPAIILLGKFSDMLRLFFSGLNFVILMQLANKL